jgi:PAS domain S-box-containing protein
MIELKTTANLAARGKPAKKAPDGPQLVRGQSPEASKENGADRGPNHLFSSADRKEPTPQDGATKRPRSGEVLRNSETRYRRLFETAQDGILIPDPKTGFITDVNPFLIKLLNYSREEFPGKTLWDIGLFKDVDASKTAFRELQANRYVRYEDLPLETRDGRSINVEFVSNVYGVNGRKVIQCNIRDITKRK